MVARGEATDALLDTYDIERRHHAGKVVEYAVDAGRLIDALSGKGGVPDESAGYGGGREFPRIGGPLILGSGVFVGAQSSQSRADDGTWTDQRFGSGFALLVADPDLAVPEVWFRIGARTVSVKRGETGDHGCSIVRPDRYISAAVDTQQELDDVTAAILATMGISTESV